MARLAMPQEENDLALQGAPSGRFEAGTRERLLPIGKRNRAMLHRVGPM